MRKKKKKKKKNWNTIVKAIDSIGGFEWIFIHILKSAAFSLQTSENKLKPP